MPNDEKPPLTAPLTDAARWLVVVRGRNGLRRFLTVEGDGWTSKAHVFEGRLMTREEADRVAADPGLALTWSDMRVELRHDDLLAEHAALRESLRAAEEERDAHAEAYRLAVQREDASNLLLQEAESALRQAQAEQDAARRDLADMARGVAPFIAAFAAYNTSRSLGPDEREALNRMTWSLDGARAALARAGVHVSERGDVAPTPGPATTDREESDRGT